MRESEGIVGRLMIDIGLRNILLVLIYSTQKFNIRIEWSKRVRY